MVILIFFCVTLINLTVLSADIQVNNISQPIEDLYDNRDIEQRKFKS